MSNLLTDVDVSTPRRREEHQAWVEEVRLGYHAQLVLAKARQIEMQRVLERTPMHTTPGLGQRVACIDPVIYWDMERRFGKGCWRNAEFRKRMLHDEPSLRVHYRERNTSVRVDGLRGSQESRKAGKGSARGRTGGKR